MNWRRLGLVWRPDGSKPWARSHASLPLPLRRGNGVHRVFVATRDDANRSHVAWVDVELAEPPRVVAVADTPALAPGASGAFDDGGVYPSSFVEDEGRLRLYYIGWRPGTPPPLFFAAVGLAESDDGGVTFRRTSPEPVLDRNDDDPHLVTSPCVLRDGGAYRMWYVSGRGWREERGALQSLYDIRHAASADGVSWRRDARPALPLGDGETNLARPCVLRDRDRYRMWFAHASHGPYRIGYAESADGLAWERSGVGALPPSGQGWDSEATAYPWVVRDGRRLTMFYNGNAYGRDGFGVAVADAA